MSDETAISEEIAKLTSTAKELGEQMKEAASTDEGRYNELKGQLDKVTEDFQAAKQREAQVIREQEADERMKRLEADLSAIRSPSKANVIGPGIAPTSGAAGADEFFKTLATATNPRLTGWNMEAMSEAKAALASMGSHWGDVPSDSKATVGDTDAAGGYLVPNAVVLDVDLQATVPRSVVDLATQVNGVRGNSVDIPYEADAISRAVIAAAGATKENSNFAVNNYTATLYTLARIFDVGNQLLRHSGGAAEKLVRSKLARAFALGEDYYFLNGTGSSQPYGVLTALGTSGAHVTTFSSPSDSTVAGSIISAVLTAAGQLADLGVVPDGVVLNSGNFYQMARQGADTAGFWRDPFETISQIGEDGNGPGGLRWRHSPNMPSDSIVIGEYRDLLFVRGQGYRVDTSSEAGDRWDKNLTGFRGEEEIAFDARPSVYTLHFKRIVNAIA
jgi:HK97 family phage major capsid protein